MKKLAVFLLLFLAPGLLCAQTAAPPHGLALCEEVSKNLKNAGFSPEQQPLLSSGMNEFPYSLTLSFPAKRLNSDTETALRRNFIICVTMEDAYRHADFLNSIIKKSAAADRDYTLNFLVSSGDEQNLSSVTQIKGTPVFVRSLNTPDDYSALSLSFAGTKTVTVIPGSGGNTAPKWLAELICSSLTQCGIPYTFRGGSLGSLYRLGILRNDERTEAFLDAGIPCAGISFPRDGNADLYADSVSRLAASFTAENTETWDRHYIPLIPEKPAYWAGERFTVVFYIITAFISLFLLCLKRKNKIEAEKKTHTVMILLLLPLTLAASFVSFTVSQPFALFLGRITQFGFLSLFAVKTISAFILVSVLFFVCIKFMGVYEDREYSDLVTYASVFNIFIFSTVDISLFYLFLLEYIIVYLSKPVKRTFAMSILSFTLFLPFLPYAYEILISSEPSGLYGIVNCGFFGNLASAFIFVPFFIEWLRILARVNRVWKTRNMSTRRKYAKYAVSFSCFIAFLAVFFTLSVRYLTGRVKSGQKTVPLLVKKSGQELSVTSKDSTYFGETGRAVTIDTGRQAELCIFTVESEGASSVLYSDNPYHSDKNENKDTFLIPSWPSQHLEFIYVADPEVPAELSVTAVYPVKDSGQLYELCRKTIRIPAARQKGGS